MSLRSAMYSWVRGGPEPFRYFPETERIRSSPTK